MRIKTALINKLIKPLGVTLKPGIPIVLIKEEYGYKHWFFIPNVPANDFIKWWKRQPMQGLKYLPLHKIGTFIEASSNTNYKWKYEDIKDQSNMNIIINFQDYLLNLWYSLKAKNIDGIWYAHLFYDEDTLLKPSLNLYVRHYGRHLARLQLEKDLEEQRQKDKICF